MAMIRKDRWTERLHERVDDWRWRWRYWWLDTESGARAHVVVLCLSFLVLLYQVVRMALQAIAPAPRITGQHAVYWWVIQLIIALVAAVLSYALRPKVPKTPTPKVQGPTVEDGLCIDDHFGEVWVDPQILAWKVVATQKIKSKTGGKK